MKVKVKFIIDSRFKADTKGIERYFDEIIIEINTKI